MRLRIGKAFNSFKLTDYLEDNIYTIHLKTLLET